MWTLAFGHHEDRTPTAGYEPTCEEAMAAFANSWRQKLKKAPDGPGLGVLTREKNLEGPESL